MMCTVHVACSRKLCEWTPVSGISWFGHPTDCGSGQALDAMCFTACLNTLNRAKRAVLSRSAAEYPALSYRV